MDIKIVFLNGNLDEEVYMDQPMGFIEKRKEHMVCKLKKSIYRLKQLYFLLFSFFIPVRKEGWFFGISWPEITPLIVSPTKI